MAPYDVIVIGGGHNSLVAAAYLSRSGRKVVVLERRPQLGGLAGTEEPWPGFRVDTEWSDARLFLPQVVEELELKRHGLELDEPELSAVALGDNGEALPLWRDAERTAAAIRPRSARDAERYPRFLAFVDRLARWLATSATMLPPTPSESGARELLGWLRVGRGLRRLGPRDMTDLARLVGLSARDFLDDWFENPLLKGALATAGVTGSALGPYEVGTAYMMLYQRGGPALGTSLVRGGTGRLIESIAAAARAAGAETRCDSEVTRILTAGGRATGVRLANGEDLSSRVVLSGLDPRTTLLGLVGARELEPRVVRKLRNLRLRGAQARVDLALSAEPRFASLDEATSRQAARFLLCPSLAYLERAYDDSKYGRRSRAPFLDARIPSLRDPSLAPAGQHVMSISVQYLPHQPEAPEWNDEQRHQLADQVVAMLGAHAPGLGASVLHRRIRTPGDVERTFGAANGDVLHGQMGLDQLFFMRPVPGFARYQSPIAGLYLGGGGCHPGGGLTGAPGYNAARRILGTE